jgi:hypothetical protein
MGLAWLAFAVVGAATLLRTDRPFAVILLLPGGLAILASGVHKYPFQERLILFLVPAVYLLLAQGLRAAVSWGARWNRPVAYVACILVLVLLLRPMAVKAKRNFVDPVRDRNMRPIVQYVLQHAEADDAFFVSGGGETFQYYAGSYGLHPQQLQINTNHRIVRYYAYQRLLKGFAGKDRVWVVFAYFEGEGYQYQRYAKHLNRVGEIKDLYEVGHSRVYLVQLDP